MIIRFLDLREKEMARDISARVLGLSPLCYLLRFNLLPIVLSLSDFTFTE